MYHETYVGIVPNLSRSPGLTSVVLHPGNRTVNHGTWKVMADIYNPFEMVNEGLTLKKEPHTYPDGFIGLTNLLKSCCGASTRILIDYPAGQTTVTSAFAQLIAILIKEGFGSCIIDFDETTDVVHFREIPTTQRPAGTTDELIFLADPKTKAFAMFMFDLQEISDTRHGLAAALIAMNMHLHRYLKSGGEVFSSQDIGQFLSNPDRFNPLVLSGDTAYYLSKTSLSGRHELEDMHLEYATALKRFGFLPSGEALKFAVLMVCKLMGLRLHCLSGNDPKLDALLEDEPLGQDEYIAFDPTAPLPDWISQSEPQ